MRTDVEKHDNTNPRMTSGEHSFILKTFLLLKLNGT